MARKKVTAPKLHAERVKLDRGGYVRKGQAYAGRYFGVGEKLWRVTDDDLLDEFVRAATKKEAIAKVLHSALQQYARAADRK